MKKLFLFDIDDTLLTPKNIFIYKKLLNGKELKLTPYEYGKENTEDCIYDFRDFDSLKISIDSIKNATPISYTLNLVITQPENTDIGFITSRSFENETYIALLQWFNKYTYKIDLNFNYKFKRNLFHAVSDIYSHYPGIDTPEKKANVIKYYASKYDFITFIDDDIKNIEKVKSLKLNNVNTIHFTEKLDSLFEKI